MKIAERTFFLLLFIFLATFMGFMAVFNILFIVYVVPSGGIM